VDHLEEKFELTYLIRPNSKREHAEKDDSVCIWDCAFEPTIEGQDGIYTSFFLFIFFFFFFFLYLKKNFKKKKKIY